MATVGVLALFAQSVTTIWERREALHQQARTSCTKGDQQACQSMYADIRAASANEDVVDLAIWQFIAGLVGIFLVARTLAATRDAVREADEATQAAREAVAETSRVGEAQVRAYLSVIGAVFKPPRNALLGGPIIPIEIKLNNSGATPAINVACYCRCDCMNVREAIRHQVPERVLYTITVANVPGGETPSVDPMAHGTNTSIEKFTAASKLADADESAERPYMVLWGAIFYDDVFGKSFRSDFSFPFYYHSSLTNYELPVGQAVQRLFMPIADRADYIGKRET